MEADTYYVERILNKQISPEGKVLYYLKWCGYSDDENTWEPIENLNCPDLIEEYENTLKSNQSFRINDGNKNKITSKQSIVDSANDELKNKKQLRKLKIFKKHKYSQKHDDDVSSYEVEEVNSQEKMASTPYLQNQTTKFLINTKDSKLLDGCSKKNKYCNDVLKLCSKKKTSINKNISDNSSKNKIAEPTKKNPNALNKASVSQKKIKKHVFQKMYFSSENSDESSDAYETDVLENSERNGLQEKIVKSVSDENTFETSTAVNYDNVNNKGKNVKSKDIDKHSDSESKVKIAANFNTCKNSDKEHTSTESCTEISKMTDKEVLIGTKCVTSNIKTHNLFDDVEELKQHDSNNRLMFSINNEPQFHKNNEIDVSELAEINNNVNDVLQKPKKQIKDSNTITLPNIAKNPVNDSVEPKKIIKISGIKNIYKCKFIINKSKNVKKCNVVAHNPEIVQVEEDILVVKENLSSVLIASRSLNTKCMSKSDCSIVNKKGKYTLNDGFKSSNLINSFKCITNEDVNSSKNFVNEEESIDVNIKQKKIKLTGIKKFNKKNFILKKKKIISSANKNEAMNVHSGQNKDKKNLVMTVDSQTLDNNTISTNNMQHLSEENCDNSVDKIRKLYINKEPEEILGATDVMGPLIFLMKWKGSGETNLIEESVARKFYSQTVIEYYEKLCKWIHR